MSDLNSQQVPQRKMGEPSKRRERSQSNRYSNMKSISFFIIKLLSNYQTIRINDLIKILYQIIIQSELGKEILHKGLEVPQFDVLTAVKNKYASEQSPSQPTPLMKNVKRRIYDVLNVLVSSKAILKNKHFISFPKLHAIRKQEQYELRSLLNEREELQNKIEEKRKELQKSKHILKLAQVLHQHNSTNNTESVQKIMLPITAVMVRPFTNITIEDRLVFIESQQPTHVFGDKDLIEKIHEYGKRKISR